MQIHWCLVQPQVSITVMLPFGHRVRRC